MHDEAGGDGGGARVCVARRLDEAAAALNETGRGGSVGGCYLREPVAWEARQ